MLTPPSGSSTPSGSTAQGMVEGAELGTRYRIDALLGQGGMGRVFKVFDKELNRTVALKVLRPEWVGDAVATARFKQELLLASSVSHRHILRIHDLGEAGGVKFITMAFVEGTDLHHLIEEQGRLPVERAIKIARQLCEALEAAHAEGVVHRDLKPQNILMGANDHVYVSDFGLAKSLEASQAGMTRTGAVMGTPRYLAPEQVEGKPADRGSDLYSLGLIFYEMVTGDVPFKGESTLQLMLQRLKEKPQEPRQLNPEIPEYFNRIILKCLEKDPRARYQSAREILDDLDEARAPARTRTMRIPVPAVDTKTWISIAAAVVLLAALAFAIPGVRHWVLRQPAAGTGLTASGVPPLSQGKFLAVVPFRIIGDKNALGYIADGLVEALSAKLFQLQTVKMSSAAATQKVNPDDPMEKIARSLGANLLLAGMVQGAGDQIRIIVNLEDVADGKRVFSQEFSGVQADLFTLEDQIYNQVVNALKVKLSSEEQAEAVAHPTENLQAYDLYLRGRTALRGQQDIKNVQASVDFFNQALEKDHGFALAYAGLADANLLLYKANKDSLYAQKALGAAQQAQQLNDKLPEIHFSLGAVYNATGKNAESIAELQRALQLAPNSDEGYRRLGSAFFANGQKKEALAAFQKAVEINPYYWVNQNALGNAYFNTGDLARALACYKRVTELEPDNAVGYENTATVYFQQGRYTDCIPIYQKAIQMGGHWYAYSNLGFAYFNLKQYSQAVGMFEKASQMNPNDETVMGNLADAYRWSGQKDKAAATYDQAIALAFKELEVNPRKADAKGSLALYFAKKGDATRALDFIKQALAIEPANVNLIYNQAVVENLAGHTDASLAALRKAFVAGYPPDNAEADPEFGNLQGRPEFQKLVKEFSKKSG